MKVNELFEATLKGGAVNKPSYRDDIGQVRGSVINWMDAMGVTKEHIAKALQQLKGTPLFRNDLPAAGLVYKPTPGKESRGTLLFTIPTPKWTITNGRVFGASTVNDLHRMRNHQYNVYANGQIRWEDEFQNNRSPLKSPKPKMKAGDPVGSLVMIYTAALKELLSKIQKKKAREATDLVKAKKLLSSKE